MIMRPTYRRLALLLLLGTAPSCGEETAIIAEVDISAFSVPADLDLVYLEMTQGTEALIGHDVRLDAGQQAAIIRLLPGKRSPDAFDLAAYGYLGTARVARSVPQRATFSDGESVRLRFAILPVP